MIVYLPFIVVMVTEVMKVLRAKKYAKTKRQQQQQESVDKLQSAAQDKQSSGSETQEVFTKQDTSQVFSTCLQELMNDLVKITYV